MVAIGAELWFNPAMFKDEAIGLLGGTAAAAAELMGVTYQAVNKWPDLLPSRISDRVLGVCARRGIAIPDRYIDHKAIPGVDSQRRVAINSEAKEAAHA